MERVTIIGGTGFIGDYLVKVLAQEPDLKLKVTYRNTPPLNLVRNVEYLQIDGAFQFKKLKEVLEKTDYLVLLFRPDKKLITNIVNTNIKFKRILYTSTILIYPDAEFKQNENSMLMPVNNYEREKIKEEKILSDFAKKTGNKLTIARLTNVYGDTKNRALIHWILRALVTDSGFILNNKGNAVRDFIFVEDVVRYLEALIFLKQQSAVEIFNVCTGAGFSINQVIEIAGETAGKKLQIIEGDITKEKVYVIGDNMKIVMATGIKPEYNLKSGLKKAFSNYLKTAEFVRS